MKRIGILGVLFTSIIIVCVLFALMSISSCESFLNAGIRVYDVKTYEYDSANFTNRISVNVTFANVVIQNGSSSNLVVIMSNYVDAGGYTYGKEYLAEHTMAIISTNVPGELFVENNSEIEVDFWNIYDYGIDLYLLVPAGVSIKTEHVVAMSGNIEILNNNTIGNIIVSVDYGNIDIRNSIASNIDINTDSGNIIIDNATSTKIDVKVASGNVDFKFITCATLNTTAASGNIDFDSVNCSGSLTTKVESGNIKTSGGALNSPNITFTASSGNIETLLSKADSINVSATSGSIKLEIDSFLDTSSTAIVDAVSGRIAIEVAESAQGNLKVDASADSGIVDVDIDFSTVSKDNLNSFIGYNGSGGNLFKLHATSGLIEVDDR